ncbi:MAG: carboxypeptidase-like regulatory domain-containing protein, partial [Prevotella sp.]|nr:carboxypeptidase-like regulatory domain-containing protein [Prevotella sp.]
MKYLHHVITFLALSCLLSCASDIVDMTGSIKGTVKDASNNAGVEGCLVTLTPTNRSTTTNVGGTFLFEELENNTYSLTFTKDGYESQTKDLTVTTGKVANVDIQLKKASQAISVNPESLDFGDLETTKELY